MKLIRFQVANSGDPVAIDPDAVVRIGFGVTPGSTFIRQVDGSSVDVASDFETVLKILNDAKGA